MNFLSKLKKWKQAVVQIKPVYEYVKRIKQITYNG